MASTNFDLSRLKKPAVYASENNGAFPSEAALAWFVRAHRSRLVKARAVVSINRRVLIDPEPFARVVLAVGAEAARNGSCK